MGISAGVQIYTHNTVLWAISNGKAKYEYKKVTIGRCNFIGPNTIISSGITIGDHCVIGAHSFVNASIPSYYIAVGIPFLKFKKLAFSQRSTIISFKGRLRFHSLMNFCDNERYKFFISFFI
ncbi:MAG: hypothetical protein HQK51_20495 [Oligoflexia bacterium]|nr:hypothetical protein [Oligoflexia bacterium]